MIRAPFAVLLVLAIHCVVARPGRNSNSATPQHQYPTSPSPIEVHSGYEHQNPTGQMPAENRRRREIPYPTGPEGAEGPEVYEEIELTDQIPGEGPEGYEEMELTEPIPGEGSAENEEIELSEPIPGEVPEGYVHTDANGLPLPEESSEPPAIGHPTGPPPRE
ncbi:hypothetical protein Ciccas_014072 [Cichlidogyrus casuarinus]|uniref:Uncharacterized protein n=1 Tax=Cichlidogyrus casuarinus TaxID=1844966 RepID=A0ABD2PKE5_9PLAT